MKPEEMIIPEGLNKLFLLCRDEKQKVYFLNTLQKMPFEVQQQIHGATQLMQYMAAALQTVHSYSHEWNIEDKIQLEEAIKKYKEWK